MEAERFLLKWNNHQSNLVTVFDQLYEQEAFTDVTLACDGRTFAAHKVILSACSPYFQALFLGNPCKHPIIFMKDVRAGDMEALLSFMYRGEINVHQQDLASFLKTAECLHIKGLSDSSERHKDTSKILEAMERKFCNPLMQQAFSNPSSTPTSSSSATTTMGGTPSLGTPAIGTPSVPTVSSSESPTPPNKKFKSLEGLPRILPKMKPLPTPPGLVTPVPGLLTPITLAATVIKNAAHAAHIAQNAHVSPPTPDTANSSPNTETSTPPKEVKKEGYISGDSPHPVYLVSSVGGVGAAGAVNSGNSTPSHEVKVEEEDPLDDSTFSDDQAFSSSMKNDEEPLVSFDGAQAKPAICETAIKKEPEDQLAEFDVTPSYSYLEMESGSQLGMLPLNDFEQSVSLKPSRERIGSLLERSLAEVSPSEIDTRYGLIPSRNSEMGLSSEPMSDISPGEYIGSLLERSSANLPPALSPTDDVAEDTTSSSGQMSDRLPGPTFSPGVLRALPFSEPAWAALEKITAYSRDIRRDPEAVRELVKKVKDYLRFRQLRKESQNDESDLSGHTDHTYVTQKKNNIIRHYKCSQCGKIFPKNCRHRFLSHMRTHTGERPFKCKVCGRGFSRQDHVQVHMRLHTGEKPFKCTSCNASYAHKVSLKSHKCEQYKAKQQHKEKQQLKEDTHRNSPTEDYMTTIQKENTCSKPTNNNKKNMAENASESLYSSPAMSVAPLGKPINSTNHQDDSQNFERYNGFDTKYSEEHTSIQKISEV